jgi:FlaG/FlaF family flagellin (archaellin)
MALKYETASDSTNLGRGCIPVPLQALREISSNDIPAYTDTPLANQPDGFGGLLCTTTTPALEYVNGDTDSAWRVLWAATGVDPVAFQVPIPPDLDTGEDVTLHLKAAMGGSTDTPKIDIDTFFDDGDTKVEDQSIDLSGTTYTEYTITIAAADIPSGAQTMSCELTPQAHGTDTLAITGLWLEYTKGFPGDTTWYVCRKMVTYAHKVPEPDEDGDSVDQADEVRPGGSPGGRSGWGDARERGLHRGERVEPEGGFRTE